MSGGKTCRSILHVDMDAFFASVEQRDDAELRGRPVLVGGAGRRGVLAAASYEAREYGCHSAQPMAVARRLCPQAIIVKPRGGHYSAIGRQVAVVFEEFTPAVERISIDEAFLDVTGSRRLFGDAKNIAASIKMRVREVVGLTASVGVAPNKFLAKLASDMDKPDGLTEITPENVRAVIDELPVSRMWGVGAAAEAKLAGLGIRTFRDLRMYPAEVLARSVGSSAERLVRLAGGEDDRPVQSGSGAKSISQEQTFGENLTNVEDVRLVLLQQAEHVAQRLRAKELVAGSVTVKIRFGDFQTVTRSGTLDPVSDRTDVIAGAAKAAFDRWAERGFQPVRLIGVGVSGLTEGGEQMALFDRSGDERRQRLDRASDIICERFGDRAIRRGG